MTTAVTDWGVTDWVDPDATSGVVYDEFQGELGIVITAGVEPVTGTAAWTEAADTSAGSGTIGVNGTSSWTEAADTSAGTGAHGVTGTGAWTEASDTCAGTGTFTAPTVVADPYPATATIHDTGHQTTLKDTGHHATLREQRN